MHTDHRRKSIGPSSHHRPETRGRARRALLVSLALLAAEAVGAGPVRAFQEPGAASPGADRLRVYLDCSRGACDEDLYRQEIRFVTWVREPQDAQVHVIQTSQDAGGGRRYTLDLIGRQDVAEMTDRYTHASSATDVEDEVVRALVHVLSLGLVRYAVAAGFGEALNVAVGEPPAGDVPGPGSVQEDPWDQWVFEVEADASYESEDLQESRQLGAGLSANRTTEAWKLNIRAQGEFERERFELSDRTEHNDQDSWSVSTFAVKSLGSHLGVGAEVSADNSTQLNRKLLLGLGSGLEYNYFPYAQSSRRVLFTRYIVSAERAQYQDTTVLGVLDETVFRHEVSVEYEAREPWGNASLGAGVRQYLDRPDAWSLNVEAFLRYRIFRGLAVVLDAEYERVRDQIYLSEEELSDEDVLLGRRRLPTASRTDIGIGLSYSFGSIFNDVVNERFRFGIF
jgi:hypothetical protein